MTERTAQIIQFPSRRMGRLEPWVTKAELAEHLQVSERWIEIRMRDDDLPKLKDPVSRLVRFKISEVERWMAERRTA